jgi:Domain of unknown function DUF29
MSKLAETSELVAYADDLNAWALQQIELLRAGRFAELDVQNLVEELRALAISQEHEIENRLTVLLQHLLKWEHQPDRRSNGWRATILEQRYRIGRVIAKSPSLQRHPAEVLDKEYRLARLRAADETGIPLKRLPATCPYSAADALDERFWPGGAGDFEE